MTSQTELVLSQHDVAMKSKKKEELIESRWKKSQLGDKNEGDEERQAVQRKLDELLRDPTEDLIIGNPRSNVSTDLQTASELYRKQVERFTPDYESMSSSDEYDEHSSIADNFGREDWITSAQSNEGCSFLCCFPGEDFSGEDYAVEVYAREHLRRKEQYY